MRPNILWLLAFLSLTSALAVVYVRHQHRIASTLIEAEENRRDQLNEEWGQLLIEENLWAFPHRIERDAIKLLGMRAPQAKEVQLLKQDSFIKLADTAEVDHDAR